MDRSGFVGSWWGGAVRVQPKRARTRVLRESRVGCAGAVRRRTAPLRMVVEHPEQQSKEGELRERQSAEAPEGMSALSRVQVWTKNWVPMWTLDDLSADKITQATVLGLEYVIYRSEGRWIVQRDRCPHRLAPLSEGRINEQGHLECIYHGWSFDARGSCTRIPDADPETHDKSCARVPCVQTFRTREALGILWAWLDPETADLADSVELEMDPRELDPAGTFKYDTFMRYLPLDWDTVMENVIDPAHVPFAHHGVQGNRDKFMRWVMKGEANADEASGFRMQNQNSSSQVVFAPPFVVNYPPVLRVHVVPVRPGLTCLISRRASIKYMKGIVPLLPRDFVRFLSHMESHEVLDGDTPFLILQDEVLKRETADGSDWRSSYHIATASDVGVVWFRNWFEKFCNNRVPYTAGARPRAAVSPVSDAGFARSELVLDRWNQHTKHCSTCLGAYNMMQRACTALGWFAAGDLLAIALLGNRLGWLATLPLAALFIAALVVIRYLQTGSIQQLVWREYEQRE